MNQVWIKFAALLNLRRQAEIVKMRNVIIFRRCQDNLLSAVGAHALDWGLVENFIRFIRVNEFRDLELIVLV